MHNVQYNRARSGPEDGDAFVNARKELQDWMESEEEQKGKQLFRKIGIDLRTYVHTHVHTHMCVYVYVRVYVRDCTYV